ncbi:MAG: ABC transporter ATP-binding protein [Spirochaetales bacterium]|nr:ABC transporter ATP-binding protein [Spirochaetales bacterium]
MKALQAHPQFTDTHTLLKAEDITVHYGEITALRRVSLNIPAKRVTVLIGPSGCGKSTTLRSLNGLVKPSSGHIDYQDASIHTLSETDLRRSMGYAIQSVGLMPHMTVEENVDLVPRLLGWKKAGRGERVSRMLQLVQLDPQTYRWKYPNELSGGEAQRVGVARALAADPPVLLMDEPFGAVDPLTREQLQDEFIRIQRQLKKTVVFVTHDIDEAVRLSDYLVIMKDGKIVQADSPEQILAEPADEFVERFLGPDRSLKRLTLFTTDRFMDPARSGRGSVSEDQLTDASSGCWWRVDAKGAPVSGSAWIQGRLVERPVTSAAQILQTYSSLKESMSAILSLGLNSAPVVDTNGKICGEVRLETIQKVSLS